MVRYPTVGALPLAQAARVETVLVKEELEWRRGGVQRARVEQWVGSGRRVGSARRGWRRGGGDEEAESRSRRWVVAVSTRRGRRREAGNADCPELEGLPRPLLGLQLRGRGHAKSKCQHPNRAFRLAPTPHVARQLGPETASLRFRQGHLKQRQYCTPNPQDDMNRPYRNWHANHPAKTPGRPVEGPACLRGHSTGVDQLARSACSNVAPTVHSLARSQPRWPQRREDIHHPWRIHRCQRGPKVHRHGCKSMQ